MKTFGITLLVFSALNFIVAIAASANGAGDAVGQKMSAAILLAVVGGLLTYFGQQKSKKRTEELAAKEKSEREAKEAQHKVEEHRRIQEQIDDEKKAHQETMKKESHTHSYKILYFHLDCEPCFEQDEELSKCALSLPKRVINPDIEDDIAEKYHVVRLPKLILVDENGTEIKRWCGVTPTSEINEFIYENKYANRTFQTSTEDFISDEDDPEIPKPLTNSITASDMALIQSEEYRDALLNIMADGGTKEQTLVKFEILLGKRQKTEAMLAIEEPIREMYRRAFDEACKSLNIGTTPNIITKIQVTNAIMEVYKYFNDKENEGSKAKEKMQEIANRYCVSINIIEHEENQRALAKYRDGKNVD